MRARLPVSLSLASVAFALLTISSTARASTLSVNGMNSAGAFVGDPLSIAISGGPGFPAYLFADLSGGPTALFGQSLPLGFSAALIVIPLGSMPASGSITINTSFPMIAGLDDLTVHLLAMVADPAAMFGYDFSNGAAIHVVAKPGAGAHQGTLVGREVMLDGRSFADGNGELKPNRSVLWSFSNLPSGSATQIDNPTMPFASFTPDVPGNYEVRATASVFGLTATPKTTVRVWSITTTPYVDGAVIPTSPVQMTGTLDGPYVPVVLVDNQPVPVNPTTRTFGPVQVFFAGGDVVARQEVRIIDTDLSTARFSQTFSCGIAAAPSAPAATSVNNVLQQGTLDDVSEIVEATVEAADIDAEIQAIDPFLLAKETGPLGNVVFKATGDFKSITYDSNMTLTTDAKNSYFDVTHKIKDIVVKIDVYGSVLGVNYSNVATIKTDPATLATDLALALVGDAVKVTTSNTDVTLANFNFTMNGFIGTAAQLNSIQQGIKSAFEGFLEKQLTRLLEDGFEQVIGDMSVSQSLQSTAGVDTDVRVSFSDLHHFTGGLRLGFDSTATTNSQLPGAPIVAIYRGTPSAAPSFGPLTPSGGAYDSVVSLGDDLMNQVLAAATEAGITEGEVPPSLSGGSLGLTAGSLAIAIPEAGFDSFDPTAPIMLRRHATVAPTVRMTPAGPGDADMIVSNLEVSFEMDTSYGAIRVLRVGLDETLQLQLGVAADGTVDVTQLGATGGLSIIQTLPGSLLAFLPTGLLPPGVVCQEPVSLLKGLRIPSLSGSGLAHNATENVLVGPAQDHLASFGTTALAP